MAVQEGHEKVVQVLLDMGANTEIKREVYDFIGDFRFSFCNLTHNFQKKKKKKKRLEQLLFSLLLNWGVKNFSNFSWTKGLMLMLHLRFFSLGSFFLYFNQINKQ